MKYAIRTIMGQIIHKGDSITDAMRFYIRVNPGDAIVKKSKGEWVRLK
jgi:hypothetical protein